MRQGECFGLYLDRIEFLRRTLRVDQQLVLVQKRDPFLAPTKTAASHRTIPLPQVVVTTVAEHVERFPVEQDDGLIFTDDDGEPIRGSRARFGGQPSIRQLRHEALARTG